MNYHCTQVSKDKVIDFSNDIDTTDTVVSIYNLVHRLGDGYTTIVYYRPRDEEHKTFILMKYGMCYDCIESNYYRLRSQFSHTYTMSLPEYIRFYELSQNNHSV